MTDPNSPAMPCETWLRPIPHPGLTKREYFAALAMQGIASQMTSDNFSVAMPRMAEQQKTSIEGSSARCAVAFADALIAELNRTAK